MFVEESRVSLDPVFLLLEKRRFSCGEGRGGRTRIRWNNYGPLTPNKSLFKTVLQQSQN